MSFSSASACRAAICPSFLTASAERVRTLSALSSISAIREPICSPRSVTAEERALICSFFCLISSFSASICPSFSFDAAVRVWICPAFSFTSASRDSVRAVFCFELSSRVLICSSFSSMEAFREATRSSLAATLPFSSAIRVFRPSISLSFAVSCFSSSSSFRAWDLASSAAFAISVCRASIRSSRVVTAESSSSTRACRSPASSVRALTRSFFSFSSVLTARIRSSMPEREAWSSLTRVSLFRLPLRNSTPNTTATTASREMMTPARPFFIEAYPFR